MEDKERTMAIRLTVSIPHVFKERGTLEDLDFILARIKTAIFHKGLSLEVQKVLVGTLVHLGRFKAGFINAEDLRVIMKEASVKLWCPSVNDAFIEVAS